MSAKRVSAASQTRTMLRRFSPWALLVVGSLMALIAGATVLAAWWLDSSRTATVAYAVPGELLGIELRVQSGNVTIVGGSRSGVSVSRSDHSVYGHGPPRGLSRLGEYHDQRGLDQRRGLLRVGARCHIGQREHQRRYLLLAGTTRSF